MTATNGWTRTERQLAEPHGLNLNVLPPRVDDVDESAERPTPQDAAQSAGLLTSTATVGSLLKMAGQHWNVHGYSDGDAEWLTPLVTQAAADRSD